MTARIVALLIGSVCGASAGYALTPTESVRRLALMNIQYSGVVDAHDIDRNQILLTVPTSFAHSATSSAPVSFEYDDATEWRSMEFRFKNGILEQRATAPESERGLPENALLTAIIYSREDGRFYAPYIAYLKKVEL